MTVLYSTAQHSTAQYSSKMLGWQVATVEWPGWRYTQRHWGSIYSLHYTTLYTTLRNVNTVIRTGAGAGDRVLINTPHVVSSEDSDNTSQSQ